MCIRDSSIRDGVIVTPGGNVYLPDGNVVLPGGGANDPTYLIPVSYTHLDVYKRQPL